MEAPCAIACLEVYLCLDTCRPEFKFMLRKSKLTVEIAIL